MLSTREQFKAAFLYDCAQRGLSLEETLAAAQEARTKLAESNLLASAGSALSSLATPIKYLANTGGTAAGALALAAPFAVGGLAGYGAAKLTGLNDEDPEEVKQRELISTLQRYAEQARVNKALKDYQGQTRRPGRPLL